MISRKENKILDFLKGLINSNNETSSKRFTGIVILLSILIYSLCVNKIDTSVLDLLITLVYVGCALLGLGILDKFKGLK